MRKAHLFNGVGMLIPEGEPHRIGDRRPVVLNPARMPSALSQQGQPLAQVITTGTTCTRDLSSAEVRMPPGHGSLAHVHCYTDVAVVVLEGQAITLWWDQHGVMHELPQSAGEHLFIPPGVPHAAINPYHARVIAVEVRGNPDFTADNHLLPRLDHDVTRRLAAPAAS